MTSKTLSLTPALQAYIHAHGVREPALLTALREETIATFEAAPMQISPEQGQFFRFLLQTLNAKQILEIGTFTGYSASCFALAIPTDGHVTCCDSSIDWTRLAVKYWEKMGLTDKITLHLGPARKTLEKLLTEGKENTFDFAFIDADKLNYDFYYEACLKLIKVGGIIAIDNVLWNGEVVNADNQNENTKVIRQLNTKIQNDDRITHCLLPIGDGVTLIRNSR